MPDDRAVAISDFVRRYRSGSLTARQIFEASGYEAVHDTISKEDIEAVVAREPGLVDDRLTFTTDKRWTPAWGLERRGGGAGSYFGSSKAGSKPSRFPMRRRSRRAP